MGLRIQPVQGPRGPHLFRSSQVSAEFDFEHALQMSPLLPKQMTLQPFRTDTAFRDDIVTPIKQKQGHSFLLDAVLGVPESESLVRSWSTEQVIEWMYETGMDSAVIDCFDVNDIDGFVLVDLKFEDLKELGIQSFGKRHQLWNAICQLKGEEGHPSPQPTPFQDVSRPCTSNSRRSPSRGRNEGRRDAMDDDDAALQPRAKSKRRGRKAPKVKDVITPAESVSIVAIEQLVPKAHQCAKGQRCAKWRKQQRDLEQLQSEHGIGRFPISPTKGGHIFVAGNPGNASTAENMISNVRAQSQAQNQPQIQGQLRLEDPFRPVSEQPLESAGFPSVVASSDVLGPGQLPEFALHEDVLQHLGSRDPQDNVKQFLQFQHVQSPIQDAAPPSPPYEMFPSKSVSPFPATIPQVHHEAPAVMQPPRQSSLGAPTLSTQLRGLPKLDIPRSQSAGPQMIRAAANSPQTARPGPGMGMTICRSATASPASIYRQGTPATVMDVPITAVPIGPVSRDTSQSVPPNMQFRPQHQLSRSHSRSEAPHWRRPSLALPAVQENEVFSPTADVEKASRPSISTSQSTSSIPTRSSSVRDPAHHSPVTQQFGYGSDTTHAGWMRKRKTKILRHEWNESHFRLKGTQLTQHASARLSAEVKDTINVDDYAVACSSVSHNSKLTAAFKSFALSKSPEKKASTAAAATDVTAFAFQLIPSAPEKKGSGSSTSSTSGSGSWGKAEGKKAHHFAVKTKDDRIDWMRELMLAKAREQKEKGYEVEVNGVPQA